MSNLYSTELKTQYFDPRTNNSAQCEFRFDPDTAYYPNITIANLKAISAVEHGYNGSQGAYSLLKHVRLMDGRVELDSVRFYNRFAGFQNTNNTNRHNTDMGGVMGKHGQGYLLNSNAVVRPAETTLYNALARTSGNTTDKDGAMIDLRVVLPLLNNITYLDTSLFKNLKVVIEWETDSSKIIVVDNVATSPAVPVLIADEIRDPSVVANLKSKQGAVVWNAIEHDLFQVADGKAVAGALANDVKSTQSTTKTINGYDNKYVERILLAKSLTTKSGNFVGNGVLGVGDASSYAQHNEKLQVQINGKPLFSGVGLEKSSQKMMLLHQTWGECNIAPFCHQENVGLDNGASVNVDGVLAVETVNGQANSQSNRVGQFAYMGFNMNTRVNVLQFEYSRDLVKDTFTPQRNNEGLDIHIYAEVRRGLTLGANEYNVKYL